MVSPLTIATCLDAGAGAGAGFCSWARIGIARAATGNRTSNRFIEIPPKALRRRGAEQGYGASAFRWLKAPKELCKSPCATDLRKSAAFFVHRHYIRQYVYSHEICAVRSTKKL